MTVETYMRCPSSTASNSAIVIKSLWKTRKLTSLVYTKATRLMMSGIIFYRHQCLAIISVETI